MSKRRMQHVKFHSVGELLEFLPEDQLEVTLRLREIVLETIPDVAERLAYNVPYYRMHANICFIWPGVVPWGKGTQEGVRFGFTKGYLIPDEIGYLDKGGRKQVFWRDFMRLDDIDASILAAYLTAAVEIDEEDWKRKQRR